MADVGNKHQQEENMEDQRMKINPERNRYPYCIVWTPIPLLT